MLGSCLTLVVVALSKRGAAAGSDAELMMSAAAANGAALRGVELFVNGERRCSQMPCRVEGVGSGAHLVRLTVRETPKVTPHLSLDELPPSEDKPEVNVEDRSSRSLVKPREPAPQAAPPPEPAKAALPSAPAETTPATTGAAAESAPARSSASTQSHGAAASPAPASAAAVSTTAAAPLGTINVTSNTPANVAVDGKVLGRAPRSIRVSSGVHTVVIAGAKGRRVQTVRVESGRPRRVAARF